MLLLNLNDGLSQIDRWNVRIEAASSTIDSSKASSDDHYYDDASSDGTIDLCSLDDDSSLLGDASDRKKIDEGTDICHDIGNKVKNTTGTLPPYTYNTKKAAAKTQVYKCPMCDVHNLDTHHLNKHLCITHFGLKEANLVTRKKNKYECPRCKQLLECNAIWKHFIQEHTTVAFKPRMCKMSEVASTTTNQDKVKSTVKRERDEENDLQGNLEVKKSKRGDSKKSQRSAWV